MRERCIGTFTAEQVTHLNQVPYLWKYLLIMQQNVKESWIKGVVIFRRLKENRSGCQKAARTAETQL